MTSPQVSSPATGTSSELPPPQGTTTVAPPPRWRSMSERVTHRFVFRRRLPGPFRQARIWVSSEGGLRYLRPRLSLVDPPLLRMVAELVHPGCTVWDVGANVGLFSFAAAALAGPTGRVLAVEPDCWLVELLRRSARMNRHLAPVDVAPVAVSDRIGMGRFHIADRCRSANHLDGYGSSQTGGTRSTQLVPTVTLDWLITHFPRPDVLKIDVESAEALVLQGGRSVLESRPRLVCEVAERNAAKVADLLRPWGYQFFDGALPSFRRRPLDRAPWALLAIATP